IAILSYWTSGQSHSGHFPVKLLRGIAVAREREIMGQTEIARVSRLATMGAMVASIAHEIRAATGGCGCQLACRYALARKGRAYSE
ncbi:MAG: hypothetical protein WA720_12095, partial [Pseudolabrys sp.]